MMNEKGAVLPITLAFVLAFTLLGFSTIYLSTMQNEAAEKQIASEKAFWLADGGIQKALWEVKYNSCLGLVSKASGMTCPEGCAKCGVKTFASDKVVDKLEGHYDLEMTSASSSVTSTGSYPSRTPAPNRVQRTIRLENESQFNYAIFAEEKIIIYNNTIIDSYNSDFGGYGDMINGVPNKAANGDVGTNKGKLLPSDDESISLMSSGAFINGDVSTGSKGEISLSHKGDIKDYVSGSITDDNHEFLPMVVVPPDLTSLKQELSPQGLNVDRPIKIPKNAADDKDNIFSSSTKDYKNFIFSSIEVSGNGNLIVDGDVKIYLTGDNAITALQVRSSSEVTIDPNSSLTLYTDGDISVRTGSKINNLTRDPKKLIIKSTVVSDDPTDGVDILSSSDFYGAIYAPGAHVNIANNGNVFGAFVGGDFTFHGGSSQLHYDESLAGKITDPTTVWREVSDHLN